MGVETPKRLAGLLALLLLASGAAAAPWESAGWPERVLSGDTMVMGGEVVRLHGLDAPAYKQNCGTPAQPTGIWPCGQWAQIRVRLEIARAYEAGGSFHCIAAVDYLDGQGRRLVVCGVNGEDLGTILVARGLAVATIPLYRPFEDYARERKLGVWSGPFTLPSEWRDSGL